MGWSGWEVDFSLSGMNKSITSFTVGPQMFYLKFIHVRDPFKSCFLPLLSQKTPGTLVESRQRA